MQSHPCSEGGWTPEAFHPHNTLAQLKRRQSRRKRRKEEKKEKKKEKKKEEKKRKKMMGGKKNERNQRLTETVQAKEKEER